MARKSTIERRERLENPAYLLLLIRDGITEWNALCEHFGIDPATPATLYGMLMERLLRLSEVGLVDLNQIPKDLWSGAAGLTFKISDSWTKIQSVLRVSLKDLARLSPRSLLVEPFFGPPHGDVVADVFVMMPFRPELQPVYEDHISRVAKALKLNVRRADDFFGAHAIMTDIWNAIVGTKVCIADCTDRNANVFYEIGIAHSIGRRVVLVAQRAEDIPFDLHHVRCILYELTPRGMKKFEETLRTTLVEELDLGVEP